MVLSGKVALITGGAGGIGRAIAEEFLENNIKGITIADINTELGEQTVRELNEKYNEKVQFVKTNVTDIDNFENAFKQTVQKFNQLDILVNNAGLMNEINWEKSVQVNLIGSINGIQLAIEKYLPKHKSGAKAYIINLSSISGLVPVEMSPVYNATKYAVIGLTRTYGIDRYLHKDGIYIMALCPSGTNTVMGDYMREIVRHKDVFDELMAKFNAHQQQVEAVGKAAIAAIKDSESGSAWLVEMGVATKIKFPSLEDMSGIKPAVMN